MSHFVQTSRVRRRYVPDVSRLLTQCESNYWLVKSVLGQATSASGGRALGWRLLEDDRYTQTVLLQEVGTSSHWSYGFRRFLVRLYHDAQLAEVLEWHNRRILKGCYPYPNAAMLQPDEKQRVNEFLADWLLHCRRRRLAVVMLSHDNSPRTESP